MKARHEVASLKAALRVFLRELPDPKRTDIPAVSDQFTIGDKDVTLTAQKAKSSSGFKWRIEYPN